MFICAFWVIVITGLYKSAPIGDYPLIFLTNLGVALVAIRFCLSDTFVRLALVALIFVVLDSIALSIVMLGSVALFA